MSFLEYYFESQKSFEDIHGEYTIVLIQKGKFYECYQYDTVGKAIEFAQLINTTLTVLNKNKPISATNPHMAGFQTGFIDRNLPILLDNNYTVVVIDEDPNNTQLRSVKAVFSPGTYIDNNQVSNNFLCVYIDFNKKNQYFFSISSIDLSTGNVKLYEIHSGNTLMKFEECYRIIESLNPSEIIVVSNSILQHQYKCVFDNSRRKIRFIDYVSDIATLSYQNSIFKDVYNIRSPLSAIEYLDLVQYPMACYALAFILKYCLEHNKRIVCNLNYPVFENFENRLILHNNSIYQLNIINHTKEKSLLSIIDYTSTAMGKRLLKDTLLNPCCDPSKLQIAYDELESMIPVYRDYEIKLKQIVDIEKLHRKMGLGTLKPYELWSLVESYEALKWILKAENPVLFQLFESYYEMIKKEFQVNVLKDHKDFEINVFCNNVFPEIDLMFEKIEHINTELNIICTTLNTYIPGNGTVKLESDCIETTQARSKKIKDQTSDYTFVVENKSKTIVKNSNIDTLFHEKKKTIDLLKPKIEKLYYTKIESIYNEHHTTFQNIHDIVSYADLKKSKAKCAVLNQYTKPILSSSKCLHINKMKHPIIEQLDNDSVFDPYSVSFDENNTGILLYGVNGSGKSTFSKSIALNVILAQSGHYVCAESMEFKPYERLYTRLGDADNIYKGQSSFFVEMNELKSILHYSDVNSLIIGDEPCRGTEDNSALSIVSFTLEWLLNKSSTFVFATHLHQLPELSCLKNHPKLMIKHVSVEYNENNVLVYTHKIEDGKCKRNYGLEIAQKILNLPDFEERTNDIFREITKQTSRKRSKYNKNVYTVKCEICSSTENMHTHHIIYQHNFDAQSPLKDVRGNLVTLCEKHHIMTHQRKLSIHGWKQSLDGPILDYTFV